MALTLNQKIRLPHSNGETRTVRLTRGQAIKQMCLMCNGWNPDPDLCNVSRRMALKEVQNCPPGVQTCPLHPFRLGKGGGNRAGAIKLKCQICMGYVNIAGIVSPISKQTATNRVKQCEDENCPLYRYRLGRELI